MGREVGINVADESITDWVAARYCFGIYTYIVRGTFEGHGTDWCLGTSSRLGQKIRPFLHPRSKFKVGRKHCDSVALM